MQRTFVLLAWLASPAWAAGVRPYPQLDFGASPAQISTSCAAARHEAAFRLRQVADLPDSARTFANTPGAIESILDDLNDRTAADAFLENVAASSQTRAASADCRGLLRDFGAYTAQEKGRLVFSRKDLFRAVSAYAAQAPSLEPVRRRLLDRELMDFKRAGTEISLERRAILSAVRERISMLQDDYAQNLAAAPDYLLVSKAEVAGLPATYVAGLPRLMGQYVIRAGGADYLPFMRNSPDAAARRRLEFLYHNRAAAQNVADLSEILRLRDVAAHILGYRDYAAYALEGSMAGNPKQVLGFLKNMQEKLAPPARRELKILAALKTGAEGARSDAIQAWDWNYYDRELKEKKLSLSDAAAVRSCFPLDRVLKGLFALNQTLFGVAFERVPDAESWAPGVDLYEVRGDAGQGPILGYLYLDLFSRPGKSGSAAAFPIIRGRRLSDGAYQKPVSALVAGFAAGRPGAPPFLSYGAHGQVQALFRAFGGAMAWTLTRAPYERFAGFDAIPDFTAVPGDVMEDFAWRPEVLALISRDPRDPSRGLPRALLRRVLAARRADLALENLRRVFFASLDMRYHLDPPVTKLTAVYQKMAKKISLIPMTPGTNPEAGLPELARGAGGYGRLWSEVCAQDAFSRFAKEGVLNPAMGWLYRQEILAPGSSRPAPESLRAFLGRAPSDEAFLKSLGVSR
ncbi:MAG: Zn-dependent oligopeptidase [Elusimicrobia bacterium]|nr:Zn-dependent oligopeptidase [Elusimicrobiota bacterium]